MDTHYAVKTAVGVHFSHFGTTMGVHFCLCPKIMCVPFIGKMRPIFVQYLGYLLQSLAMTRSVPRYGDGVAG